MLSGLRFLHSASTRTACRIQPCHQPVLVWTRQSDFQDADPHRRWFTEGVPVRTYRDLVGLLSGTGETVVAQHCSDWNQDLVPAISRPCGVRCSPLSHSGQTAADSSREPHWAPRAPAAPCSTSTLGPWSGSMITRPVTVPPEKLV
jgi:hypothetical protein